MDIDSQKLGEVAALMERHGLTRVSLSEENGRVVELERMTAVAAAPIAAPAPAPVSASFEPSCAGAIPADPAAGTETAGQAATSAAEPSSTDTAATAAVNQDLVEVSAPMMGVFYAAPSPDSEPFVHVGDSVRAGDTLCIIETMKLMNEVVAETDGTVAEILATDGDLIEYGACLMKIDVSGDSAESEA